MSNKPHNFPYAGINTDEYFRTGLKGLYAIGDCCNGLHGCGAATISGLLTGDSIQTYVSEAGEPSVDEAQVASQRRVALALWYLLDGVPEVGDRHHLPSIIVVIVTQYQGSLIITTYLH